MLDLREAYLTYRHGTPATLETAGVRLIARMKQGRVIATGSQTEIRNAQATIIRPGANRTLLLNEHAMTRTPTAFDILPTTARAHYNMALALKHLREGTAPSPLTLPEELFLKIGSGEETFCTSQLPYRYDEKKLPPLTRNAFQESRDKQTEFLHQNGFHAEPDAFRPHPDNPALALLDDFGYVTRTPLRKPKNLGRRTRGTRSLLRRENRPIARRQNFPGRQRHRRP